MSDPSRIAIPSASQLNSKEPFMSLLSVLGTNYVEVYGNYTYTVKALAPHVQDEEYLLFTLATTSTICRARNSHVHGKLN